MLCCAMEMKLGC